jgi:hypothetical protein
MDRRTPQRPVGCPLMSHKILASGRYRTIPDVSRAARGRPTGLIRVASEHSPWIVLETSISRESWLRQIWATVLQSFLLPPSGDAVPIRTISGSATTIVGLGAFPMAVDSADNIYISTADLGEPDSILIFNSSVSGNVPPTSTIGGPATTIYGIQGLALDSAGNIYLSNIPSDNPNEEILEFSAGSTGNVAPIRTISGSATAMSAIGNLALDSAGNIYVLNDLNLLKFASNATGNATPIATITTPASLIFTNSIAVH